jgi:hypothetical protein
MATVRQLYPIGPPLNHVTRASEPSTCPAEQGPNEAVAASQAAIDCILDAHETGQAREADFVLLGTEGDEFRLIVQTLDDGTINLYWGTDTVEIYEGCETLKIVEPFFSADDC